MDAVNGKNLADLPIGRQARIKQICGELVRGGDLPINPEELERRLLEIGFVEGGDVTVLHCGPVGRDPIAVQLGNMIVALRRQEAKAVVVED